MNFFNQLTFSRKLWALSLIFTTIVGVLSFSNYYWMKALGIDTEEIGNVQLPAVKSMAVIDMYHDGTRGVVMTGFVQYQIQGKNAVNAQLDELKEFDDSFQKEFSSIAQMPLAAETADKIKAAHVEVGQFVSVARETLTFLSLGQEAEAQTQLAKFEQQFSVLEERLESLGEVIEKNSANILATAIEREHTALSINISFAVGGIVLCLFLSWFIIKGLNKSLEEVYLTLKQDAIQLKAISHELGEGSKNLGQSSEEQASSVQETASTLDEINSMIARGTENVEKAVQLGASSGHKAQEGGQAVKEMIGAIEDIKNSNEEIMTQLTESNKKVAEICDVIRLISEKTKAINDIVFQTKLLSFNASVEAARAGEHGKGFAVVAEEVGNLAQNSGKASQEIFKILDESLSKVENIISDGQKRVTVLITNGKERIESGMKVASRCEGVLSEVLQDVHTIGSMISEINEFSREQKTGVQNISVAVNQLDQSAQTSASLSRSLLETSVSLIQGSENLELAVNKLEAQIYEEKKRTQKLPEHAKILSYHHSENGEGQGKKAA